MIKAGHANWLSWLPFSISDLTSVLSHILVLTFAWSGMVFTNHWGEIISMLTEYNTWSAFIGAAFAFYRVTVIDMGSEFFSVLLSNPIDLFSTKVILETLLFIDVITGSIYHVTTFVIGWVPGFLSYPLVWISANIHFTYSVIISTMSSFINSSWSFLVDGIAGVITPHVPSVIAPAVNAVFHKVASGIAISFLLWLFRLFIGLPF